MIRNPAVVGDATTTTPAARREGEITIIAHMMLGGRGPALAFLNTANVQFRGLPMDVAKASQQGLVRVKRGIYDLANRQPDKT